MDFVDLVAVVVVMVVDFSCGFGCGGGLLWLVVMSCGFIYLFILVLLWVMVAKVVSMADSGGGCG